LAKGRASYLSFGTTVFFLKTVQEEPFAFLDDGVALGLEFFTDCPAAAGVLRVGLAILLSVRQYGVMRLRPCRDYSSAAWAAIHEKIPVVIRQTKSVWCILDRAVRSALMVVSLPLGTFFISESTSIGVGITNQPSPNFLENLPSLGQAGGMFLLSIQQKKLDCKLLTIWLTPDFFCISLCAWIILLVQFLTTS